MILASAQTADIFRYLVMGEGFVLVGFALAVFVEARRFKIPPTEIYLASASYIGLALAYTLEIYDHIGEGYGRRVTTGAVVFTFGIVAMYWMHRAYNYEARAKRHRERSDQYAFDMTRKEYERRERERT